MSSFLKGLFGNKEEGAPDGLEVDVEVTSNETDEPTPSFHTLTILDGRGVTPEERDRVAKAQQLLRSLPESTPAEVKREIVEAALKAFGVSIEDIVSAARHEIEVLSVYIGETESAMEQLEEQQHQRISALERQIEGMRKELAKAEQGQEALARQARAVVDEIEPVLRFFAPLGPPRRAVREASEPPKDDSAKRAG